MFFYGVGGTIKRLAAHTSLKRPFSNQILTLKQLFEFAEANVYGITSLVSCEEVANNTEFPSHDLLHQVHLKEHGVTIISFPTLQVWFLEWRRHHFQHTQKKLTWLRVAAAKCRWRLRILSLESSTRTNMTITGISVLWTRCQVSMVMWINSFVLKVL